MPSSAADVQFYGSSSRRTASHAGGELRQHSERRSARGRKRRGGQTRPLFAPASPPESGWDPLLASYTNASAPAPLTHWPIHSDCTHTHRGLHAAAARQMRRSGPRSSRRRSSSILSGARTATLPQRYDRAPSDRATFEAAAAVRACNTPRREGDRPYEKARRRRPWMRRWPISRSRRLLCYVQLASHSRSSLFLVFLICFLSFFFFFIWL